jgi:hypothetical protein
MHALDCGISTENLRGNGYPVDMFLGCGYMQYNMPYKFKSNRRYTLYSPSFTIPPSRPSQEEEFVFAQIKSEPMPRRHELER